MTLDEKVAAALRECEEAMQVCHGVVIDSSSPGEVEAATAALKSMLSVAYVKTLAAIARYGDLREKAGRLEQAEKMLPGTEEDIEDHERRIFAERDRLRGEVEG